MSVTGKKPPEFKLPHGEVTQDDLKAFATTMFYYRKFRKSYKNFPTPNRAKCLLYFIYDFACIGMDEVSDYLMEEIDDICPEYFDEFYKDDVDKDENFAKICLKLSKLYYRLRLG